MTYYVGYDVTFQEVPGEVSLTIDIADCPLHCPGCHSPILQGAVGEDLERDLPTLLARYKDAVTCVCFMGTGRDYNALLHCNEMAWAAGLKTAIYTGEDEEEASWLWLFPTGKPEYIKFGPYDRVLGGLDSPYTNQRMYRIDQQTHFYEDITPLFQKKKNRLDEQIEKENQ